jgi:hypothetical protein
MKKKRMKNRMKGGRGRRMMIGRKKREAERWKEEGRRKKQRR